jgi:hypothetical protein
MMKTLMRMRPQVLKQSISLAFQLCRLAFRFSAFVRFSFRTHLHDSYSVQYRYFRCGGVLNWRVHAEHMSSLHIGACQDSRAEQSIWIAAILGSSLSSPAICAMLSTKYYQRSTYDKLEENTQHQHDARRCGNRAGDISCSWSLPRSSW